MDQNGRSLNRGPLTIFQDKLLTRTYCDEAGGYYAVSNVLSPRNLVFRDDLSSSCTCIANLLKG